MLTPRKLVECLVKLSHLTTVMTVLACSSSPVEGLALPTLDSHDIEVWCDDEDWGSYPCGTTGYGYVEAELLSYSTTWDQAPGLNVCRAQRLVRAENPYSVTSSNRKALWGPDNNTYDAHSEGVTYPHWNTTCSALTNWGASDDLTGKRCSDPSVPTATRQAFLDFCNSKEGDAMNGLEQLEVGFKEAKDCVILDWVINNYSCQGSDQTYDTYNVSCEWGVVHAPQLEEAIRQSASYHCVNDGDTLSVAEPDDPAKGHVTVAADACTCSCVEVTNGYACFSCFKFAYLGNVEEVARDPWESDISSGIPVPGLMIGTNYTSAAVADADCETLTDGLRFQLYGPDASGHPIYVDHPVYGTGLGYCHNASCVNP